MNQLPTKSTGFFKNLLIVLILTCIFFAVLTLGVTYFLEKIPRFEKFYVFVPWIVTFLTALFLSFVSKSFGQDGVLVTSVSSVIIGLLFLVIGFVLGMDFQTFPIVLARYVFLVIGSILLSVYLNGKMHKRRSSGKKFKFSK